VTRFEFRIEYELAQKWLKEFSQALAPFYSEWIHKEVSISDILNLIRIPYIPYWSFGERLPVVEKGTSDPEDIGYWLENLTALIAQNLSSSELLITNRDSFVQTAIKSPSEELSEQLDKPAPKASHSLPKQPAFPGAVREQYPPLETKSTKSNAINIASWIGFAGVIVVAVATLIGHVGNDKSELPQPVITAKPANVTQAGPGTVHITNVHAVNPEQFQWLARELGVTQAALKSFFKILEQKQVPPEALDGTLRNIAKNYKELLQEVGSDDAGLAGLKRQAKVVLEAGNFDRAEALLNEASAKNLEAARKMPERAKEWLLSAASLKAENGNLKYAKLAYGEAAAYYREAAELVPEGEALILAKYLNLQGLAFFRAGRYSDAQSPLQRSLALWEKTLGPDHPDVATSLNNLASLYRVQGQYGKAEVLFQRSLAIREKTLETISKR
jgi:Tetratricopeptide repeat